MRCHTIHSRAHTKLTHTEEDVLALRIDVEVCRVLEDRLRRSRKIGCTADQLRYRLTDGLQHDLARITRRNPLLRREGLDLRIPSSRKLCLQQTLELLRQIGVLLLVLIELLVPALVLLSSLALGLKPVLS